jgi:hypothetical protein
VSEHKWSDLIYAHPNGEVHYNVKDENGQDKCDKVIGRWLEGVTADERGTITLDAMRGSLSDRHDVGGRDGNDVNIKSQGQSAPQGFPSLAAQETPQDVPDVSYGPAPVAAQDWPVTREPHGLLKGKALPAVVHYERPALLTEGPITWEQYCELVANLEAIELNLPFWIGDTIIKGEELFGERAYQPWTERGYGVERIRHYAWVAQQVPPGTRVPNLSFTHHRAVAALPPGEQAEWLERAETEGMSSRQLRECVTTRREPEGCQHEWQCQKCGATK